MKMENILLTAFIGTSSEILLRQITKYETLFLPNDKISIECTGKDGIGCIETSFDCNELKRAFELHGIATKVSSNAGTSFCN